MADIPASRPLIIASILLATGMTVLDSTIANVALPHMQGSLETSQDEIAWVLTSYLVAAAIGTPAVGWLAGRFGRKWVLVVTVLGFTIASALCGMAQTLFQMVVFRFIQGATGALVPPLTQSTLADVYPDAERARGMAMFALGTMAVPVLGPTLGGWITDSFNWRWVFYINLPLGILAVAGAILFVPDTKRMPDRQFDAMGFAFMSLSIGAFQLMLGRGEELGWFSSSEILIEAVLCGFGLYMYVAHASTLTRHAFIEASVFKDRAFTVGLMMMALGSVVLFGTQAIVPELLQGQLNYPVLTAGWLMAPRGLGMMAAAVAAGRLAKYLDMRVMLGIGLGILGLSYFLMGGWSLDVQSREIIWLAVVQGAGMGLIFPPLMTIPWATLAPELRSDAAGVFSLARNLGASIGITVTASRAASLTQLNHAHLAEYMTPYRHLWSAREFADKLFLPRMNMSITRQAAMVAEINIFWLMGIVSFACVPIIFLVRLPRTSGAGREGTVHAVE